MSITIKLFWKLKLIIHLVDIDVSDGNVRIGLELNWK